MSKLRSVCLEGVSGVAVTPTGPQAAGTHSASPEVPWVYMRVHMPGHMHVPMQRRRLEWELRALGYHEQTNRTALASNSRLLVAG